jgi:septation ring formation regulator EzrA
MKHQYHFESLNVWREATQTKTLIADIDRIVQILNADIAAEEEQAGIFDCSRPEYPVLARALAARRDNLKETIAALEQRLELTRALDLGPHPSSTARPFRK